MSVEVIKLKLEKCCDNEPIIKEKKNKKTHETKFTITCKYCGAIVGCDYDYINAVENWNKFQLNDRVIKQIRKDIRSTLDILE